LAVQNTYLSAFQLLGALGLLLGTVGLGVTQIRGALERKAELASMRALGFTKRRLVWILALENGWQLFRGLAIGGVAASLATVPALLAGQPFGGLVTPLMMLGLILLVGGLTSWFAASFAMRWPLLAALRSET
jgi:ABC-type antimicrobial peptide transport system permease subunit